MPAHMWWSLVWAVAGDTPRSLLPFAATARKSHAAPPNWAAIARESQAAPPNCLREQRENMDNWYAVDRNSPRAAREEDCTFVCEKGSARDWCVASEFTVEGNGSCSLFAVSRSVQHTNMNDWYHPHRPARESDCKFICVKGSAKDWCVESEFSTEDNGSCKLSSCKATENPVCTLGLAARQNAEMSFVTSLDDYVPPGSSYELTRWNNGTHDLCPYLFSKTLEHDRVTSFPLCSHVDKIVEAVSAPPEAEMFFAIQQAPGSVRKLESPQSSWDSMLMTSPATTTATATKVTDPEFGFEIAEVFAMALLRDRPFASWAHDAEVQKVMDILNSYPQKSTAPLEGGLITANTLMRGAGADETIGPYVSQYLLQPFRYGSLKVTQKYAIEKDPREPTDWNEFIKIQDGQMPKEKTALDGESFNYSPRNLGGNVHMDPLFQFYYNAALISGQCGISPSGLTGLSAPTISGFTQGGGPDMLGAVAGVALSALKAGWWHKWQQAMRIRPEAVGGLLEFCKNNLAKCERVPELRPLYDEFRQGLKNMTLAFTGRLGGSETLLLATQYPEGSPTHPSWPAGHATVAGASVTVLKAMLNTHGANNEELPWPTAKCTALEARSQEALSDYDGADKGDLTIVGELNKLASNAALGRNFAGVHFRSDGDQGLAIGEQIAIQYLKSKLQEYALKSALNSFTLEKFDGTIIEITAPEE